MAYQPLLDLYFKEPPEQMAGERNIASLMDEDDRKRVGLWAKGNYEEDKTSRSRWESWYAEAIKLALQVKEAKTYPWSDCSNVRFPLLTVATLNAHAQAFPALISGDNVVKARAIGKDPDGIKGQRAARVGKHMSFQLLELMPWEEQTDKQLIVHYLLGTTFKKTYRDNSRRQNCSDLVLPQDLVVNYWSRDMDSAPRASHCFNLTKNELYENINAQVYLEPQDPPRTVTPPTGNLEAAKDKSQLTTPTPIDGLAYPTIEQSCWMDLDQDGYEEPYAVTFDPQSGFVYRIHARYLRNDIKRSSTNSILSIQAENYYTKFGLIPSPDGGFYDLGLGRLLAPLNDAVDTLINQMIDGIHMKLLGGGFLGRGVRIKAGDNLFKPREWKNVDSPGQELAKNIFPLPVGDVPPVALELLKYLVEYGERIGSSGDIQMGQIPGSGQMKAQTAQIANENGKLIFNATFKRFWRGLKEEFRKLYRLNQLYQDDFSFTLGERNFDIRKDDYSYPDSGIVPAADPNIVSRTDKRMMADMVLQTASGLGWAGHDMEAVIKRRYEAYEVPDIDVVFPGVEKRPPQPNPKMIEVQVKQQREQTRMLDMKQKAQLAVAGLQIKAQESHAKIMQMMAQAKKLLAEAKGVDTEHEIQLLEIRIEAEQKRRDHVLEAASLIMSSIDKDEPNDGAGMAGMGQSPSNKAVSSTPTAP